MSHFVLAVIAPSEAHVTHGRDFAESYVREVLEGYNENTNSNGKCDWYQIGGRWTGMFSKSYDPRTDERNIQVCQYCNGTGDREGWVYYENGERKFKDDWAKQCNGCNVCHGTGKELKFDFVPFEGDTIKIQSLLDDWDDRFVPFAILTPDDEWIERGQMRMFACVENEKDTDEWNNQAKAIFEQYKDCDVIVVDCHT